MSLPGRRTRRRSQENLDNPQRIRENRRDRGNCEDGEMLSSIRNS